MEYDNLDLKILLEIKEELKNIHKSLFEIAIKSRKNECSKMNDILGAEEVEIKIRHDKKVIWVNTENGCVLRIGKIKNLVLIDESAKK